MNSDLKAGIETTFWRWFVRGTVGANGRKSRAGIRRLLNPWIVVHVGIAFVLSWLIPKSLEAASSAVLLPILGILVGLSFAWGGTAQNLLQTTELGKLAQVHDGGFADYVFIFQLAVFVVLLSLSFWGLAGLGFFDDVWPTADCQRCYAAVKGVLYCLLSLSIRECWHVVLASQDMLRVFHHLS